MGFELGWQMLDANEASTLVSLGVSTLWSSKSKPSFPLDLDQRGLRPFLRHRGLQLYLNHPRVSLQSNASTPTGSAGVLGPVSDPDPRHRNAPDVPVHLPAVHQAPPAPGAAHAADVLAGAGATDPRPTPVHQGPFGLRHAGDDAGSARGGRGSRRTRAPPSCFSSRAGASARRSSPTPSRSGRARGPSPLVAVPTEDSPSHRRPGGAARSERVGPDGCPTPLPLDPDAVPAPGCVDPCSCNYGLFCFFDYSSHFV